MIYIAILAHISITLLWVYLSDKYDKKHYIFIF